MHAMAGWPPDERTDATNPHPALRTDELTPEIVAEVAAIARALPYRSALPADSGRVFWIDVAGRERMGIAWTADAPDGAWWLVAIGRTDGRRVPRSRLRQVAEWLAGPGIGYEVAPDHSPAPGLTLIRLKAD